MNDQGVDPSAGPGGAGAQWQTRVVDTVEDVVSAVHDRVIRPLVLVTRAVVFGILVATMTLLVSILLSIAVVRLLDVYAFRGRVWASDALVGGLLTVGGLVLWTRRRSRGNAPTP
ncbi:MAG TPA: hypothetical protein VN791_00595 [Acidimicrobiales bacterium]|nr:hypothetical protein [Acidimicrobiales bacterium]